MNWMWFIAIVAAMALLLWLFSRAIIKGIGGFLGKLANRRKGE